MDKLLLNAIQILIEEAENAVEVLDRYSDVRDGDYGVPEPNAAMVAHSALLEAVTRVNARMPKDER
jgi:hypothetical protein